MKQTRRTNDLNGAKKLKRSTVSGAVALGADLAGKRLEQ